MSGSEKNFISWGATAGVPEAVLEHLLEFAATPEEMQAAINDARPSPPIYPIDDVRALHEKDLMGLNPDKAGFLIVGTCPNGDPIAVDIGQEPGTVWYLSHEQMFGRDLRSVAVKIASSISALCQALKADKSFPLGPIDIQSCTKMGNRVSGRDGQTI